MRESRDLTVVSSSLAESLLVAVREGRRLLDHPTQDLLLRTVDAFSAARERILGGDEFRADEALLQALAQPKGLRTPSSWAWSRSRCRRPTAAERHLRAR
jgi:hypothetical protein